MSITDFLAQIATLTGGRQVDERTRLVDLAHYQRIAVTRWLSDVFIQPAAFEVIDQFDTIGDAWKWLQAELDGGAELRCLPASEPGAFTTRVRLRPVMHHDIAPLYEATFDPVTAGRWGWRGRTVPPEAFAASLFDGVVAQFMVEMRETGSAVGMVRAYDDNPSGQHCKVAFLRCGARQPGDAGALFEGVCVFLTYVFANFPYRKVWAEVPAYNLGLYATGFATDEATLTEFLFHEGQFVDLHVVSIARAQAAALHVATGW